MALSYLEKQEQIKKLFASCPDQEARYNLLISLGKDLKPLAPEWRVTENLVSGCQSIMYLHSSWEDGKVHYSIYSEALISTGLAALLISVYNGEMPETILKCPPAFIDEIGIRASLTPGRSNGLASLYLKMKQEALKLLVSHNFIKA